MPAIEVGTLGPGGPAALQLVVHPHTGETALLLMLALIAACVALAFNRGGQRRRR